MDNYYTSVQLFEDLEVRKTLACQWTVRSNRVDLLKEIFGLKEQKVKQVKRVESLYRQKGNVTCVTWRDQKPVSVLATQLPQVQLELGKRETLLSQGVTDLSNTYMGGVDVSDQRAVAYARLVRGVVWYYKGFFYMVELCVSNAYIFHCRCPDHATITSLEFRKSVIKALVQGKCFGRDITCDQAEF